MRAERQTGGILTGLAGEELGQNGGEGHGGNLVCLAFQRAILRAGNGTSDGLRGVAHERRAGSAVQHERRNSDRRRL